MWRCSRCHESVPSNFDVCWKCGTGKNGSPPDAGQPDPSAAATHADEDGEDLDQLVQRAIPIEFERQPSPVPREQWSATSLLLRFALFAAIVLLGWVCVFWVMGAYLFANLAPEHDERQFANDADRMAFIESFTPIKLPREASDIRLKYVGWLDHELDASFVLRAAKLQELQETLRRELPDSRTPGQHSYERRQRDSLLDGSIDIDLKTATVKIHATESPVSPPQADDSARESRRE